MADYPFTTLHPNLGVVRVGPERSFVIADIPGLIEGAAEGAGLGHRFLRHLQRTGLLLHLVDLAPPDPASDPVADARAIVRELARYDEALADKPRWLVLNKIDMVPPEDRQRVVDDFTARFFDHPQVRADDLQQRVFTISGLTREGCEGLCQAIQRHLEATRPAPTEDVDSDVRFAAAHTGDAPREA